MNPLAGFLAVLSAAGILLPAFSAECFQLDPGGRKKLFYYAEHEIGRGDPDAEYAVVWIHGMHGASADSARLLRKKLSGMENGDKVYCIAPSFAESKLLKNPAMRDKTLLWDRENWRGGGKSSNGPQISSFTVIDQICGTLADRKKYPRIRHILIAGFSAGGQFVSRYAAVGKPPEAEGLRYSFAAGAPSTYLYIDNRRFIRGSFKQPDQPVRNFNQWRNGLENLPEYAKGITSGRIMKNLSSRCILFLCGSADTGKKDLSMTPDAMLQGKNRYERFTIFQQYVKLFPQWEKKTRFKTVPGVAHSTAKVMFDSGEFLSLIFGRRSDEP